MSIFHRATGIGLTLGLPVMTAWLVMAAGGPKTYQMFTDLFQNWFGQALLFGWSWAFFYHFCTGVRHLLWDSGLFLSIKGVYSSGWIAFGVSSLVTAYVWLRVFGFVP